MCFRPVLNLVKARGLVVSMRERRVLESFVIRNAGEVNRRCEKHRIGLSGRVGGTHEGEEGGGVGEEECSE